MRRSTTQPRTNDDAARRFVASCCRGTGVRGRVRAQGIAWEDLSDAQRHLLAPQAAALESTSTRRARSKSRAARERWLEMSRRDRAAGARSFSRLAGPDATSNARPIRERYQDFRRLPPDERAQLLDTYRRYRMMPPERRIELRQRFRELTPEQRRVLRERRLRAPAR